MNKIEQIYQFLYQKYGPQGWWPLQDFQGTNPTKTGSVMGYHPENYDLPSTSEQVFEICIGAILTQNVGWPNVEKALLNLKGLGVLNPKYLLALDDDKLKEVIRPAGYYNQKAKKIRIFTDFFLDLERTPTREELLDIWGIGKETADSMLLYAFKVPTFVVDTYTRRIFFNLGLIDEMAEYDEIKALFEDNLRPDLAIYQEYHALIVEHAKRYYLKKSEYHLCPLHKKSMIGRAD